MCPIDGLLCNSPFIFVFCSFDSGDPPDRRNFTCWRVHGILLPLKPLAPIVAKHKPFDNLARFSDRLVMHAILAMVHTFGWRLEVDFNFQVFADPDHSLASRASL